ncbi:Rieske (2Fe-2S) protein [Rubripirellula reticaptiva]|uniref:Anthranilate 1,2-dioxygenase ferredoxin subunit n=1 Tax=Rubripirellula reticaptiva TaxID=2528013 RepID=A0A5C6ERT9_9BACT|nr:Rieske (2Fe-2S) protein [Rubripirellula reticaptiva]TWU51345.1 Anthranilate 1,2-dioxygenase ferredoxin subunit [Rubripirellula reticaptiva]
MTTHWTDIGASESILEGSAIETLVGDQILAVFRSGGELFAMDGMCAHQGGPIAQGAVCDGCVTCPWHGWQYELSTGIQTINRQPLMRTFKVRESGGRIEVEIDG